MSLGFVREQSDSTFRLFEITTFRLFVLVGVATFCIYKWGRRAAKFRVELFSKERNNLSEAY